MLFVNVNAATVTEAINEARMIRRALVVSLQGRLTAADAQVLDDAKIEDLAEFMAACGEQFPQLASWEESLQDVLQHIDDQDYVDRWTRENAKSIFFYIRTFSPELTQQIYGDAAKYGGTQYAGTQPQTTVEDVQKADTTASTFDC